MCVRAQLEACLVVKVRLWNGVDGPYAARRARAVMRALFDSNSHSSSQACFVVPLKTLA